MTTLAGFLSKGAHQRASHLLLGQGWVVVRSSSPAKTPSGALGL